MFLRACNERRAPALGSSPLLGWLGTALVTRLNWHGYFISRPPSRERERKRESESTTPRTTPEAPYTPYTETGRRAARPLILERHRRRFAVPRLVALSRVPPPTPLSAKLLTRQIYRCSLSLPRPRDSFLRLSRVCFENSTDPSRGGRGQTLLFETLL